VLVDEEGNGATEGTYLPDGKEANQFAHTHPIEGHIIGAAGMDQHQHDMLGKPGGEVPEFGEPIA
jgi:hypothetical protein